MHPSIQQRPSASHTTDDSPPRIRWSVVLLLFAVATVARFAYFYLDDVTRQTPGTLARRLLEEGTGNFASALLFPIAIVFERYFPLDRGRWRRHWPQHVAGLVLYSVAHTTVIAVTRAVLFPALGLGPYDYGIMSVRYFMEGAQDLFSYAMYIGLITLLRLQQRLREREVRAATLERDAANAQLDALSLRLRPHFLFNALNTISSTLYDDPAAADDLIGRLGELLRHSLRTGHRREISLGEELDVLRAYQVFVEARFGNRARFDVVVDPATHSLGVPAFLLQPLVENAVHHGLAREYGESDILVAASLDGDALQLVVENDFEVSSDSYTDRVGTGLGATRDRLRLLYGSAATVETSASGARFRVVVRIPAHVACAANRSPGGYCCARSSLTTSRRRGPRCAGCSMPREACEIVGEASTGREAVAAIKRSSPDIVFLDIQMPGLDGFEVLDAVAGDDAPYIVFVTADDRHAIRAFEVGAVDYLLKPFSRERFDRCSTEPERG